MTQKYLLKIYIAHEIVREKLQCSKQTVLTPAAIAKYVNGLWEMGSNNRMKGFE